MKLGQRIDQTRFGIETSEIKTIVAVVVKELLPHVDETVERPRDPRLVKDARGWRHQEIATHRSVCQGHVGRVIKRRRDRRGERLIFLHPLENALLAQIRIIRARRGLTLLHAARRNLGRQRRARLGAEQLRSIDILAGRVLRHAMPCENEKRQRARERDQRMASKSRNTGNSKHACRSF